VVNVQKIHGNLVRKPLPVVPVFLNESSQDIFKGCSHEEVLLPNNQSLNFEGLLRVFGIWSARDFLTFFSYLDDVSVLIDISAG
jgi:hypothetical protein